MTEGSTSNTAPLMAWDLTGPCERVALANPKWSRTRLKRAETAYRHFLFVRMMYPGTRIVPHVDVDEMWHAHILHTRDYAAMCESLFGCFFHHEPTPGGKPSQQDRDDYRITRRLLIHHFGADKDPEMWLGQRADKR